MTKSLRCSPPILCVHQATVPPRPSRAGGHGEVVGVPPAELVRPPGNRHPAPLGEERRVMPRLLRPLAYPIGEGRGPGEVAEPERALQALDAVALLDPPAGDLRAQFPDLRVGQCEFVAPASGAPRLRQPAHLPPPSISPRPGRREGWPSGRRS